MKQIETRKSKDWITQVMTDIKELRLEVDIESIKNIKKSNLKMMVTTAIREKSFQDLEKKKKNHSKVMKVKHERLEMQNYLKPNDTNIRLEEAQEIFKMRSRMSEVKTNFKGKYEDFECKICDTKEYETQQHILKCEVLNKMKARNNEPPEYEELFSRNVEKQIIIAKYFMENIKIKKKLES